MFREGFLVAGHQLDQVLRGTLGQYRENTGGVYKNIWDHRSTVYNSQDMEAT